MVGMLLPVVAIAGSAGVGKSSLAAALLAGGAGAHAHGGGAHAQGTETSGPESITWEIDTKYYDARVLLREVCVPSSSSGGSASPEVEALVLVVSCESASSWEEARAWAEASPGAMDADMKLLVANKADTLGLHGSGARPAWLEAAMEWCAGNGLEYIEVCARDAECDVRLTLDGDEQGVARCVQALHAHLWSGMALKTRTGSGGGRAPAEVEAGSSERDQQPAAGSTAPANGATTTAAAPDAAATGGDVSMALLASLAAERGVVVDADGSPATQATDKETTDVDAFDRVLGEMQGAKQRLAGLPDEERRAGAAALALRLAEMLGIGGDDDDDEEGGGSSSDDE